ncbi:hypothetical protein VTI74DRAFT_10830 [Chaetomium olivicolor]
MASPTGVAPSPGMTYQPLSPPALSYRIDDDNDDRRWRVSIRITNVVRLVLIPLAFVNIVVWGVKGVINPVYSDLYVAYIFMFLVLFWNLFLIVRSIRCTGWLRHLPVIVCKIGDCSCVLNGDEEDHDVPRKPSRFDSKRWKRIKLLLTTVIDLGFGATIIGITAACWPRTSYWDRQGKDVVIVFSSIIGALEVVAAFLCLAEWKAVHIVELGMIWGDHDGDGRHARIRLPLDTDDRRTAAGTVSIAA